MRHRLLASTTVSALAVLAVPTAATAMVQLDRGIAGARLGNSKAQVRAALGPPRRIHHDVGEFGRITEFTYAGRLRVAFVGPDQTVTTVSTRGRGDRTASGVGVGSRAARADRLPGVKCEKIGVRVCHTNEFTGGQRVTTFFLRQGRITRIDVGIVLD